ncbi:MAG: LysR family transcriptional regulator [Deltaproteobacteria bacterium]|nr:LysR family transcriptional regulator [Deltaproteobacteria bacterium]
MSQMETSLHLLEMDKVPHAAKRMAITRPTLTIGIRTQEEAAGTSVRNRSNRGISLTASDGREALWSTPAGFPKRHHIFQI